ncbi:MAG: hypothetical protein U7126_02790 [Microcoleus sp.]
MSAATIEHNLAKKYARHGAYLRQINIGGVWVTKCFLRRCPKCGKTLLGMLSVDGIEQCVESRCDYQRTVYTADELKLIGGKT